MGNFLDDINKAKANYNSQKEEAINSIAKHFYDEVNKPEFEEKLKKEIISNVSKGRKTNLNIYFWCYHSGCSETHFGASFCKRFHGDSNGMFAKYNGIELHDIRWDAIKRICDVYENKLNSLGLRYSKSLKPSSLDYPEYCYEILV